MKILDDRSKNKRPLRIINFLTHCYRSSRFIFLEFGKRAKVPKFVIQRWLGWRYMSGEQIKTFISKGFQSKFYK